MSAIPPDPLPPNENRGPRMMGMFWTMVAITTIMVSGRFYARYKIRSIGLDDWLSLFAWVSFVLGNCFITYMVANGGGRHVWYLTKDQILLAEKWSYIADPPIIFCMGFAQASDAALLIRFIDRIFVWRKRFLLFLCVTTLIVNLLSVIFLFAQCTPVQALWETEIIGAHCWDRRIALYYDYFSRGWNSFINVSIALLPTTFVPRLQISRRRKITICFLLSLGWLSVVCGAIKVKYQADITNRVDFTWSGYNLQMWAEAHVFLLMICGYIPTLMPIWERYVTHKRDASYSRIPLNYGEVGAGKTSRPDDVGSPQFKSFNSSRRGLNSTTIELGSETEVDLMPIQPERVRIITSFSVDRGSGDYM